MRSFFKYLVPMVLCIVFASVLSYFAFYSFWFSARWFHSVPVVRVCDKVGSIILLPARFVYFCSGRWTDQSLPLSDPLNYAITNGILLGTLIYSLMRPIIVRKRKIVN